MDRHNILDVVSSVNGASFAAVNTDTVVKLKKTFKSIETPDNRLTLALLRLSGIGQNPMLDRVHKVTKNSQVMLFQNKNSNGYENMVKRRLEAEGKDPNSFQLSPPVWGERIKDSPIITHKGEYYLELIFQKCGDISYYITVDGLNQPISKEDIWGLPDSGSAGSQGDLENKVHIVRYKLSSITEIRVGGKVFTGSFFYDAA